MRVNKLKIEKEIIKYFAKNHIVLVSTLDKYERIYSSVKGLVYLGEDAKAYIVDLFHNNTFKNIQKDNRISLTAVSVHHFKGYVLQGTARCLQIEDIPNVVQNKWEEHLVSRISERIIKNLQDGTVVGQPEAELPSIKYFIEVEIENIINLAPPKKEKMKGC